MSHEQPQSDSDAIDELVAEHLDRLSQQVDAHGLIDRVCRQMPHSTAEDAPTSVPESPVKQVGSSVPVGSKGRMRTIGWTLASALALVVAFFSGRSFTPSTADAANVLREVRAVHSQADDRCYRVHFTPDPEFWDGKNPLTGPSDTVLWTRGDRFWADATLGKVKLVYGRDEQGKLWVSPSRSKGIRLSSGDRDLPAEIAMYCAINSMTVPSLVEKVLRDFDLRADGPPDHRLPQEDRRPQTGSGNSVIWATLKPDHSHPFISSALLEVDKSDTLIRLILWTVAEGRPRGTITFTLVETSQIDDEQYQLPSHLDADAEVRVHQFESSPGQIEEE